MIAKPKEIPPLKKPISFEELKRMTLKHAKETKSEVNSFSVSMIYHKLCRLFDDLRLSRDNII